MCVLRSGQTEVKMTNLILASLPRDMAAIGSTKCTYTPTKADIIEEELNLFVLLSILHTIPPLVAFSLLVLQIYV